MFSLSHDPNGNHTHHVQVFDYEDQSIRENTESQVSALLET